MLLAENWLIKKPAWIIIYVTSVNDTIKNAGWVFSAIRHYTLRSIHVHHIPSPFSTTIRLVLLLKRHVQKNNLLFSCFFACRYLPLLLPLHLLYGLVNYYSLTLLVRSWLMKQTQPCALCSNRFSCENTVNLKRQLKWEESRKKLWFPFTLETFVFECKFIL